MRLYPVPFITHETELYSMKKYLGMFFALSAGILWGIIGLFVRYFSGLGMDSLQTGFIRMGIGCLCTLSYMLLFRRKDLRIRLKDLWCFAGSGLVSMLMACVTYFKAMQYVSLSAAAILMYTAPVYVALFGMLFFKERITKKTVFAMVLAFAACVLVCAPSHSGGLSPAGIAFGLCAGVCFALYSVFARFAYNRGYGTWTITFYSFVFSTLGAALLCDMGGVAEIMAMPASWSWALCLGVICAFAPYALYGLALKSLSGSVVTILSSVEPVVATLTGVLLFHEPFGIAGLFGIALMLTAIVLLAGQKTKTE